MHWCQSCILCMLVVVVNDPSGDSCKSQANKTLIHMRLTYNDSKIQAMLYVIALEKPEEGPLGPAFFLAKAVR